MTWSYTGQPAFVDRDRLRLLIGDTTESEQLVQDEVIDFELEASGGAVFRTAATLCRVIASRFAREVDFGITGVNESASDRHEHYLGLVEEYVREATRRGESASGVSTGPAGARSDAPVVGGTTIDELRERYVDRNLPRPKFSEIRDDASENYGSYIDRLDNSRIY